MSRDLWVCCWSCTGDDVIKNPAGRHAANDVRKPCRPWTEPRRTLDGLPPEPLSEDQASAKLPIQTPLTSALSDAAIPRQAPRHGGAVILPLGSGGLIGDQERAPEKMREREVMVVSPSRLGRAGMERPFDPSS